LVAKERSKPKPCHGQWLSGLLHYIGKDLDAAKITDEAKDIALKVMYLIDIEVCGRCKCRWCLSHMEVIKKIIGFDDIVQRRAKNEPEELQPQDTVQEGPQDTTQ